MTTSEVSGRLDEPGHATETKNREESPVEANIIYADGSVVEVDDLTEFVTDQGLPVDGTENVSDLVRALFVNDADIAEVIYDPDGVEVVYTASRDEFTEGYGL